MSSMEKRRYKVEGNRIVKVWDGRNDEGWFPTKAEAIAYAEPKDEQPKRRGRPPKAASE